MAHIGVIEALENKGYPIAEVVGCSMGGVVGGLYASGHLPAYREWLENLSRADILKLMDFTITKRGFLRGERVFNTILEMTGRHRIEELPMPFATVATDVATGEEVIFREGDLFEALRATVSIPGLFMPVEQGGRQLIDGGVINPLPLNLLQQRAHNLVVAVDINAPSPLRAMAKPSPRNWLNLNWPWRREESKEEDSPEEKPAEEEPSGQSNVVDVLQISYDHMQNRLIRMMEQAYPPQVLVEVPRNTCGMFEFHRAAEVIEAGREKMDAALTQWEAQQEQSVSES
jgi:NTE family protein